MKYISLVLFSVISIAVFPQQGYWQQQADYEMEIDFDHYKGQFIGKQKITYTNNSPDTLNKVFYHLYYNAFQPGSQMDIRNQTIKDPDSRLGEKIFELQPDDQGYHYVRSLKKDGKKLKYHVEGTVLEVELDQPVLPSTTVIFDLHFESQVPKIIRRSGKHNNEGIDFSMAQWYPKMAEYDKDGWHANEYIAREFYGIWGNFDVKITIDSSYTIAATGELQNAEQIGHGYTNNKVEHQKKKLTWHFKAENVHDFVWAADPDYTHDIMELDNGLRVHYFYQNDTLTENWDTLKKYIPEVFDVMNTTFGQYPYKSYAFIQGGDGGMEYPMATLVDGHRSSKRFFGTCVHELAHSWYHGVLASNESKHAWMDEGFACYAEDYTLARVLYDTTNGPSTGYSGNYRYLVDCDHQEALNTISDFYQGNRAYYTTAYQKGELFLNQLRYIVGNEVFYNALRNYFYTWKFKHPQPADFMHIVEKESGMSLDWFYHYWVETTYTIDYGIKYVAENNGKTSIVVERVGDIPMPIEVEVTFKDKTRQTYYMPLRLMRGQKQFEQSNVEVLKDWPWTYPEYAIEIERGKSEILKVEIDPHHLMVDVERKNNVWMDKTDRVVFGRP